MTHILRLFGLLAALAFAGLYWHLHLNAKNPLHKVTYQDLKATRDIRERLIQAQQSDSGDTEEKEIRGRLVAESKRQVAAYDREILLRQMSAVVGCVAVGLFAAAMVTGVASQSSAIRRLGGRRRLGIAAKRHPGRIAVEPAKVEYIDADDFPRKVRGAYVDQDDAEVWLRMDEFLRCPHCNDHADVDGIGGVQEVVFFQEGKSPGDAALERLGAAWTTRSIDQYTCKRCGEVQRRSVR